MADVSPRNCALSATLEAIESPRFSALVNVASNLETFKAAVEDQPEYQSLLAQLRDARADTLAVLEPRYHALLADCGDQAYEQPHDAALAAYLLAIQSVDGAAAWALASLTGGVNLFWSRHVALQVVAACPGA